MLSETKYVSACNDRRCPFQVPLGGFQVGTGYELYNRDAVAPRRQPCPLLIMRRWHQEGAGKEHRTFGAGGLPTMSSHECEQTCTAAFSVGTGGRDEEDAGADTALGRGAMHGSQGMRCVTTEPGKGSGPKELFSAGGVLATHGVIRAGAAGRSCPRTGVNEPTPSQRARQGASLRRGSRPRRADVVPIAITLDDRAPSPGDLCPKFRSQRGVAVCLVIRVLEQVLLHMRRRLFVAA